METRAREVHDDVAGARVMSRDRDMLRRKCDDLAIRIGWKIEPAAKMLGVYAALNPGRAKVVALPWPAKRDDITN